MRSRPALAPALLVAVMASSRASGSDPRIEWDPSTLTLVAAGGNYARMVRLPDGTILCGYDRRGVVHVRASRDNGKTWEEEVRVAAAGHGSATNAELLPLRDGGILLSFNERPNDGVHPYAIRTCVSRDGGRTWSDPALVYKAGTDFGDGCWEPAQVQLPSGEIQLFFANEGPYRSSGEQEITVVRSSDGGATWTAPRRACFRAGHRDGMPSPLVLRDGRHVAVAIEDNGLGGKFKPAIVRAPVEGGWERWVDGRSPDRWAALREPLPSPVYAGAPCLRQMPTGETVLSCQVKDGGRKEPHMVVWVGDEEARGFTSPSVPFRVPADQGCFWNSLFVKDAATVTAVSGTRPEGKGARGIWAIDGRLVRKER